VDPRQDYALPIDVANGSPRDFLIGFLHGLAQAEHELMVQYLYAAYSLGGDKANRHADFVRECRDTLLAVAREEMGHLLTVQNLLLFVGGDVSLERWPSSPTESPTEFTLEPFSLDSLDKYRQLEAPPGLAEGALTERLNERRGQGLDWGPIPMKFNLLCVTLPSRTGMFPDSIFDPATYPYQATWEEFARGHGPHNARPYALDPDLPDEDRGRVIVTTATTRMQLLSALHDILDQGESAAEASENRPQKSHFERFNGLKKKFTSILETDPNWSPSRCLATNPWVGMPGSVDTSKLSGIAVSLPETQQWAELFNLRYRMMLSLLTYLFRVPRDGSPSGGAGRSQILSRMFGEMYNMKAIAGILVQLPINDPDDGKMAGPPFQVPYTLGHPPAKATFWRMQLELLDEAANIARARLDDRRPSKRVPPEGERYLHLMRAADVQSRRWVEKILAGEVSLP
jgi:hypothetical protein